MAGIVIFGTLAVLEMFAIVWLLDRCDQYEQDMRRATKATDDLRRAIRGEF